MIIDKKKKDFKKILWNMKNILITIKHLGIKQNPALNNPYGVVMLLNK